MNSKLQVFATKLFSRWMRKNKIAHHELFSAAAEMAQGLIHADLGGHVVKKRVAVGGRGRSIRRSNHLGNQFLEQVDLYIWI